MKQINLKLIVISLALAFLALPLVVAHSAGGRIEGKVTNPNGAVVVGAIVTVAGPAGDQTLTAVTDGDGRYKIEGLNAGTYTVTISARGFSNARREDVKVEEGAVAAVALKKKIAPIESTVNVSSPAAKANADPVYQQLRQSGRNEADFGGPFAAVSNLVLTRDAATFTLRYGELYFSSPIEGRVTSAVFIGDGELTLEPPTPIEKHTLSLFIDSEKLTEQFTHLVIRFTVKSLDGIKASPHAKMGTAGSQAARARDLYRSNQQLLRRELHDNGELRALGDLYAPQRPGYFNAFIAGSKHGKLIFLLDPLGIPQVSPEEVALFSYGDSDGGIWTAFHLTSEYANGTASSSEDHRLFDITHHEIDGAIHGAQITANDRITFRSLVAGRV